MEPVIVVALIATVYFLPTLVAVSRGTKLWGLQFLVNLFAGWSGIGWLAVLIWACSSRTVAQDELDARRHAELIAAVSGGPAPARAPGLYRDRDGNLTAVR